MKKNIIISAVNLVEGGPLTVLQDCLKYLSAHLAAQYNIIALVNNKQAAFFENIQYREFPESKKSWINRLCHEYFYFKKLSEKLDPFLWLSLHDITPNVQAKRLAVYCHNASPFYKLSLKEAIMDPRFALFNLFYKYLYAINIKKNDFVIVQQDWIRNKFAKLYHPKKIIVAYPDIKAEHPAKNDEKPVRENNDFVFFYPSFPRIFKNFEVICRAAEILSKQGLKNFKILLTISGAENHYARHIYRSFKHNKNIRFLGRQEREEVLHLYGRSDCVLFPSKLETWGIPITEAKTFSKPLILADLEYAHEALGTYNKARFFNPDNAGQLAGIMKNMMDGSIIFEDTNATRVRDPFASNWQELFNILLEPA